MRRNLHYLVVLCGLALVAGGCSHRYSEDGSQDGPTGATDLLAPGAGLGLASQRSLYPLAVGNLWTYRVHTTNQITTDAGPQAPVTEENPLVVGIQGKVGLGRVYFETVEAQVRGDTLSGSLFYLRSSRLGLFELDLSFAPGGPAAAAPASVTDGPALQAYVDRTIADPARRAVFERAAADVAAKLEAANVLAGRPRMSPIRQGPRTGADPGEITLLSYPVYPGARWVVRDDPRFARLVVGRDQVHVPFGTFAAWKIRGTAEVFGPDDRVYFWYSSQGLLRVRFHLVGDAVDNTGSVVGRVVTDSDQSLTDLHLERPDATLAAGGQE